MNDSQAPKINLLPARHGLAWLAQSLILMRAQPARLLLLALLLQLILGLARLPLIGIFIIMAVPALSAGFLQAFRLVAAGQRPAMVTLFAPLASGRRAGRLLALGALMLIVGILSVGLMLSGSESMLDADLLARIEQGDMDAMAALDPALISRIVLAVAVAVSLSGTLSFLAIPLLWFGEQKLGLALISGLRALLLNWRPFTVLALSLTALLLPVAVAVAILFALAGTAGGLSFILLGLIMLIALAFQLAAFGAQFCSFRDIYGLGSAGTESGLNQSNDHQLLA